MRLFVAIAVSDQIRSRLATTQSQLRRDRVCGHSVRWIRPENLHLTVRFIGERPAAEIPALGEALANEMLLHAPLTLEFRGIRAAPSLRRARAIWAAVAPTAALTALATDTERALRPFGLEPERRFRPHVTIGRMRERPTAAVELARALAPYDAESFGEQQVTAIELLKSELHPNGASYETLERIQLTGV